MVFPNICTDAHKQTHTLTAAGGQRTAVTVAKHSSHSAYHPSSLANTGLDGMGQIYSDKDYDIACHL